MATAFKQVIPKPLDIEKMYDVFEELVTKQAKFSKTQFGLTYKTFNHKPDFKEEVKTSRTRFEGSALTTGKGSKDNPYPFITKGTSVRYATMTPDFVAKTKKRVIGSGGGRGGVMYVDKRRPRPGIEAREFEEEMAKREQPKFEKRGEKAMKKAAKVSGHAI